MWRLPVSTQQNSSSHNTVCRCQHTLYLCVLCVCLVSRLAARPLSTERQSTQFPRTTTITTTTTTAQTSTTKTTSRARARMASTTTTTTKTTTKACSLPRTQIVSLHRDIECEEPTTLAMWKLQKRDFAKRNARVCLQSPRARQYKHICIRDTAD